MHSWKNWSGSQQCNPRHIHRPHDEAELVDIVRHAENGLRVVGASHSFSALVSTDATLISLENLSGLINVDSETSQATCWAGTQICNVGNGLWDAGLSLPIQGDVDLQTLAGAYATGTHGSGINYGCLADSLRSFRLLLPDGAFLDCGANENADVFAAGRVSLGSLGIMTRVTVQCEPRYHLRQRVWSMPEDEIFERLPELTAAHRSFEFFAFPDSPYFVAQTQDGTDEPIKRAAVDIDNVFMWTASELARWAPPIARLLTKGTTRFLPTAIKVDRSYRIFPNPRRVRFHEMEYAIPAEALRDCFLEVRDAIRSQPFMNAFPIEVRWIRGDDIWLSPFYERDSVTLSVHRYHKRSYREFFASLEPIFAQYSGRPHWGKLHSLDSASLCRMYPRWNDFLQVRRRLDPEGKLLNDHVQSLLGAPR